MIIMPLEDTRQHPSGFVGLLDREQRAGREHRRLDDVLESVIGQERFERLDCLLLPPEPALRDTESVACLLGEFVPWVLVEEFLILVRGQVVQAPCEHAGCGVVGISRSDRFLRGHIPRNDQSDGNGYMSCVDHGVLPGHSMRLLCVPVAAHANWREGVVGHDAQRVAAFLKEMRYLLRTDA